MRLSPAPLCLILGLGIAASCSRDSPVATPFEPPDVPMATAEGKAAPKLNPVDDPLCIEDMLSDPLFQVLVQSIADPKLSEPLRAAVDALAKGQAAKAKNQITRARAVADALEDNPFSDALIFWSAIERFFEEAELL